MAQMRFLPLVLTVVLPIGAAQVQTPQPKSSAPSKQTWQADRSNPYRKLFPAPPIAQTMQPRATTRSKPSWMPNQSNPYRGLFQPR